jgi:GH15 family glucan-1,4-alpha-glucosidase
MAYRPIEDHGMIGDLRTIALVGMDGSIDFMCFPHYDSPTVFGALLDDVKGGRFQIAPALDGVRLKQMYLPDTNVLLTRFLSEQGVGEVTDFMPSEQPHHTHAIVRRVTCVKGPMRFSVRCAPRFDYARAAHRVEAVSPREILFVPEGAGGTRLRLRTPVDLALEGPDAAGEFVLQSDESVDFVLEIARADAPSPSADPAYADRAYQDTVRFWREWIRSSTYRGRWSDMVNRSALAMKLLCSKSTGAIAAAATFGLPEMVGGERNWDYRFTWIRDGSLTAASLVSLGFRDEARRFVRWIEDRYADSTDGSLQIMYGIDGRKDLGEQILGHLEGYRGSAPVRVGNGAYNQLQLDIYGELLYFIDAYDENVEPVTYDLWQKLSRSVDWVAENWQGKDEGIWEVRGGQQEFLYSRIMCWVALDRAIRVAARRSLPCPLARWTEARDTIYREVYEKFWSEKRQAFIQYKGNETLDASALLMPMVGLIPPRDPRWIGTLEGIDKELVEDSLVYRYRTASGASDGLSGTEGTFCMCSYWYIECLARGGDIERARFFFEKMHGYANHLGLYGEELDQTGRHLGNFPQAFTHLGLVSAARYLDEALTAAGEP